MHFLHIRSNTCPSRMLMSTSAQLPTSMEKSLTQYHSLSQKVSLSITYYTSELFLFWFLFRSFPLSLHAVFTQCLRWKLLSCCFQIQHWTSKRCWRNGRSIRLLSNKHDTPKTCQGGMELSLIKLPDPFFFFLYASRNIYRTRST